MEKIELFVGLKIPDTTAITAFHTLEKMGFSALRKLDREIYYKFYVKDNVEEFMKKITKVDILVNHNKNKFMIIKEGQNFDSIKIKVLVQDTDDDCAGLLTTLQKRLGFSNIEKMEKGVLWIMDIESKEEAEKITKKLLYNEHYQKFKLIH